MDSLAVIAIIIALLGIISSALFFKWNTYKLQVNKKKIRARSNLVIIFCVILISSLLIWQRHTYIKQTQENKKREEIEYSNTYEEILFELSNDNSMEALRKIDKLLHTIKNEEKEIELYILQGNIYMNIGLAEHNNRYLENAVLAYKEVLLPHSVASKTQIIEAKSGMGISYLSIDINIYYKELEQIIKDLENADLKEDLMGQMCLGMYYEEEYFRDFEIYDLEKVLDHYETALKIEERFSNQNIVENNLYLILQEKVANFYLRYGTYNIRDENLNVYLQKSISIYNNLLNFYDPQKNKYNYYKCLKEQGRCYAFMEDENDNLKSAYLTKAYNNMKTVLHFDDKELDDLMLGYYLFVAYFNISDADINMLFSRYDRLLKTSSVSSDKYTIRETKFNMLCCSYYWWKRSDSKKYYKIGKQVLKEIRNNYYDFYNSTQQQLIDYIDDFYKYHKMK